MSNFISKLFLISLLFTLGLSLTGLSNVFLRDASYNKEQQKLRVSICCGSGYQHNLFELRYGPVKQTMPMEVTATLTYLGDDKGTLEQGDCETTLDYDVSKMDKPIYINIVNQNHKSVRVLVD